MSRTRAPRLWHYTCHHAATHIGENGLLKPLADIVDPGTEIPWQGNVIWLTSDPDATRHNLGLTMHTTLCDRMQVRYRTSGPHQAIAWNRIRINYPAHLFADLEAGRDWSTWWVASRPVNVRLDQVMATYDGDPDIRA